MLSSRRSARSYPAQPPHDPLRASPPRGRRLGKGKKGESIVAVEGIGHVPLFADLSPEKKAALESTVRRRVFKRGEVIVHKGDPGGSLFIITEGQVKIVLPSDSGEEALLTVLNEGDFFGELSLIDGQPRSATIVTTAPTETVVLHREDFLNF